MGKYNDIDLKKWKDYKDVLTDSLWIINRRDSTGVHTSSYHGNFIPQIPHQLLTRYTKKHEWVLDPFLGSGTTLIEAQRMERNSVGIELLKNVADDAKNLIKQEKKKGIKAEIVNADSRNVDYKKIFKKLKIKKVHFIIFHPPYWDIIKFSKKKEDLSNAKTLDSFLNEFGKVIDNSTQYLDKGRYCGLVIGDKYAKSELVPLGFKCMDLFTKRGFTVKAIIVKNFGETEGKSNQQAIWRYRALAADYYVFRHEYIIIFKKN